MADKKVIIQQIESISQHRPGDWSIGATAKPAEVKSRLGNPLDWLQWQADSIADAKDIMESQIARGLKRSRLSGEGTIVYVLKG